jgi:hypothetical protein
MLRYFWGRIRVFSRENRSLCIPGLFFGAREFTDASEIPLFSRVFGPTNSATSKSASEGSFDE